MQIKNIILSVAASMALVQAVPLPQGTTGTTDNYNICYEQVLSLLKTFKPFPELFTNGVDAATCGVCFAKAVGACAPVFIDGVMTEDAKDCYRMVTEKPECQPPVTPPAAPSAAKAVRRDAPAISGLLPVSGLSIPEGTTGTKGASFDTPGPISVLSGLAIPGVSS